MICALLQHHRRLGSGEAVHQTLAALMLHHSGTARAAASHAAAACIAQSLQLCLPLIRALQHWLQNPYSTPQLADPGSPDPDTGSPTQSILSSRFVSALLSLTPRSKRKPSRSRKQTLSRSHRPQKETAATSNGDVHTASHTIPNTEPAAADSIARLEAEAGSSAPAAFVARLMLAAHHPTITAGRTKARSAWPPVRRQLQPRYYFFVSCSPESGVSTLFGSEGVSSSEASCRWVPPLCYSFAILGCLSVKLASI